MTKDESLKKKKETPPIVTLTDRTTTHSMIGQLPLPTEDETGEQPTTAVTTTNGTQASHGVSTAPIEGIRVTDNMQQARDTNLQLKCCSFNCHGFKQSVDYISQNPMFYVLRKRGYALMNFM